MNDVSRVTTGECRLSFVHLCRPYANQPGEEGKYSVTVLVPKTDVDTKARIDAAIEAATVRGVTDKWNGQRPPLVQTPVYDGDGVRPSDGMPFGPECKGHWVFTASSKADRRPELVDRNLNPIINESEIYSGMYGRVNVQFFPYAYGGKKGIGCGLGPVQKTRDGEALGGHTPSASEAFDALGDPAGAFVPATAAAPWPAAQPVPQPQPAQPQPVQPAQAAAINPITGLPW